MTAAIALFAFGAITAALSLSLTLGTLRLPGSGFFPFVLGVMLMGLAALQGWSLHRENANESASEANDGGTRRAVLFVAVVAVTTALLPTIGYVASSFLLMLGLLRVLGVRWPIAASIGAVSALAARVIFVTWLKIPVPEGLVGL